LYRGWPPLPHPLRPARPPEKRGRGTGGIGATLKMRWRREKVRGKVSGPLSNILYNLIFIITIEV
jgi:hypothetical protein